MKAETLRKMIELLENPLVGQREKRRIEGELNKYIKRCCKSIQSGWSEREKHKRWVAKEDTSVVAEYVPVGYRHRGFEIDILGELLS